MTVDSIQIGVVGCGAVTARYHLPALRRVAGARVAALADPALERARILAAQFGVPRAVADFQEMLDGVDAVVLALPHHLHATIGIAALRAGKHVLMEKPLANTVADCDALIAAARENGRVLAVAQVRRYLPAVRAVRDWLSAGLLGDIAAFEVEEGGVYRWPAASDFFFRRETAGGGVFMDTGAHVLDMLRCWLGDLTLVEYADDAAGGVEADGEMRVRSLCGAEGTIRLSRLRDLRNRCVLRGSRATLDVEPLNHRATLTPSRSKTGLAGTVEGAMDSAPDWVTLFEEQAENWLKAIRRQPAEIAAAEEARETIRLIEEAYARRRTVAGVWERPLIGAGA